MQENSKPKAEAVRISAEEWRKTHRDFKAQINGQKYVLRSGAAGTTLVPVVIEKTGAKA